MIFSIYGLNGLCLLKGKWCSIMSNIPRSKVFILFVIFLVFLLFGYFYETASYIPLDIPSPISYLPNGYWGKISYTTQHFVDEYGRVLISRKEGVAYGSYKGYSFDTPEKVMAYFHDNLSERDWVPSNSSDYYTTCRYGLPEKEYVDELYYEEYIKIGDDPQSTNSKICVVIINKRRLSWEDFDTYKVVLISSRYSPITEFLDRFRRW